jgi:hypothetical protein
MPDAPLRVFDPLREILGPHGQKILVARRVRFEPLIRRSSRSRSFTDIALAWSSAPSFQLRGRLNDDGTGVLVSSTARSNASVAV